MAPLAVDDFDRADGGLGANWTDQEEVGGSAPVIVSNAVEATTNVTDAAAFYSAVAFPDNHYSQVTAVLVDKYAGPTMRASGTGAARNRYEASQGSVASGGGINVYKWVAGSGTYLGTLGAGAADGDVIRISGVGSTIQCFRNGGQQGTDLSDSTLTSGSAGFRVSKLSSAGAVNNWSGGAAELLLPLWMALGPNSGATFADDAATGTVAWSTPGNAAASDDARATCALTVAQESHYLTATNFGFAVPETASIYGILVEVEKSATVADVIAESWMRLIKGGVIGGANQASASNWPTTDAYESYGAVDDLWEQAWTPADINAANFGVALGVAAAGTATARVDHVRITVYYLELAPERYPP